jgi:hypothetical protein
MLFCRIQNPLKTEVWKASDITSMAGHHLVDLNKPLGSFYSSTADNCEFDKHEHFDTELWLKYMIAITI